ncbi:MAG: inositol monophosphatase [Clostridia bacterium]|nr:inositol monophosphatase [Clostridia bacterium]
MNEIETLSAIIRAAGQKMLSYEAPAVYEKEGHANFVTEADIAVQQYVMEELHKAFPDAAFMGEEEEEHHLGDGLTFVVDPIDGTTNFMRHRRYSVISIGAVENGKPVFGAIYDPYHDDLYTAKRGEGAYCNGKKLQVADTPFHNALVDAGTAPYYEELWDLSIESMRKVLAACSDIRRCGTAALDLCDVAAGRADAFYEWRLQPWDYCAGNLLVEEAGGKVCAITGEEISYDKPVPILAASPACFDQMRQMLLDVKNSLSQ